MVVRVSTYNHWIDFHFGKKHYHEFSLSAENVVHDRCLKKLNVWSFKEESKDTSRWVISKD